MCVFVRARASVCVCVFVALRLHGGGSVECEVGGGREGKREGRGGCAWISFLFIFLNILPPLYRKKTEKKESASSPFCCSPPARVFPQRERERVIERVKQRARV